MFDNTKKDAVSIAKEVNKDLRNVAHKAGRRAGDIADNVNEELHEFASKASTKVRNLYHTGSDELSHAADTVSTKIRANPVQSSVIALAVGFVLGSLFRR